MEGPFCVVCGGPLAAETTAYCNGCGQPFHFRHQEAPEPEDCGQAWLHLQYLTLEFGCNLCLGRAPGLEPPVGLGH
jgi:predicted amidophosphoribosyltransferase